MTRRLLTALLAVALLVPAAAVQPVAAASYHPACDRSGENNYHGYVQKTLGPLTVSYMRATIRNIKDFDACDATWPGGQYNLGSTMVLPVNIQGPSMLVQLGMCHFGDPGPTMFCFTPNDNSSPLGIMVQFPGAELPEFGNDYAFYVAYQPGTDQWKYTIQDTTDGQSWSTYTSSSYSYGLEIWSGFEAYNDNDQVGGAGIAQRIADICYKFSGSSSMPCLNQYSSTTVWEWPEVMPWWNVNAGINGERLYVQGQTNAH